ncbi:MAG TPA: tetratricopeptide repeat protein [Rhodocyclaceae bacterium]|nr:tetratricopeptide repeat protein [Rhodocyclaceae bacterium]
MPTDPAAHNDTLARHLDQGIQAHMAGELETAQAHYDSILAAQPDMPDALRFLGILRHQQGQSEAGVALLQRSIALAPSAPAHNDLGNLLSQLGDLDGAALAFLSALELEPGDPNHWNNLGATLQKLGRLDQAAEALHGAIQVDPNFAAALHNLGDVYTARNQPEIAAEYYCRAYVQPPFEGKPWNLLGIAHACLHNAEAAAAAYREWMKAEPDNPRAHHMYAACQGGHGPERASDAFIEQTFDAYASKFENHIVGVLDYRGPEQIEAMLRSLLLPEKRHAVLDGGCGTGLCGPVLAHYATRLTGVDLSSGMLAEAQQRGCYDALEKTELTAHLNANPGSYDLISMADTVIYFGDTRALFAAAHAALRPGGLMAFTVEASDTDDYRITPSGRYQHASQQLIRILEAQGFEILAQHDHTLRREFGKPVAGLALGVRRRD